MALIPAAGKSKRMGRPKLALPLGDRTVLAHAVSAFVDADVETVLVVLAPHVADLQPIALDAGAEVLLLTEETSDMRATILRGLDWIEEHCKPNDGDAWFLSPADHPTVQATVVRDILCRWQADSSNTLFIPTCNNRRGHPALIGWNHVPAIRNLPKDRGLNWYCRKAETQALELPGFPESVLFDLDTPDDYQDLQRQIL